MNAREWAEKAVKVQDYPETPTLKRRLRVDIAGPTKAVRLWLEPDAQHTPEGVKAGVAAVLAEVIQEAIEAGRRHEAAQPVQVNVDMAGAAEEIKAHLEGIVNSGVDAMRARLFKEVAAIDHKFGIERRAGDRPLERLHPTDIGAACEFVLRVPRRDDGRITAHYAQAGQIVAIHAGLQVATVRNGRGESFEVPVADFISIGNRGRPVCDRCKANAGTPRIELGLVGEYCDACAFVMRQRQRQAVRVAEMVRANSPPVDRIVPVDWEGNIVPAPAGEPEPAADEEGTPLYELDRRVRFKRGEGPVQTGTIRRLHAHKAKYLICTQRLPCQTGLGPQCCHVVDHSDVLGYEFTYPPVQDADAERPDPAAPRALTPRETARLLAGKWAGEDSGRTVHVDKGEVASGAKTVEVGASAELVPVYLDDQGHVRPVDPTATVPPGATCVQTKPTDAASRPNPFDRDARRTPLE